MNVSYKDSRIEITSDKLIINDYYFPGFSKKIPLQNLEVIHGIEPGLFTGQWRIWGMGLSTTWFAMDWSRPWREKIFVAEIKNSGISAGFTVEYPDDAVSVLKQRGVPVEFN